MRKDGEFMWYRVEHRWKRIGLSWANTGNGARFLFEGLTFEEARGEKGDKYRALIKPTHDCWQRIGVTGFLFQSDAEKLALELALVQPEHAFRVTRRTVTQKTEPVWTADEDTTLDDIFGPGATEALAAARFPC